MASTYSPNLSIELIGTGDQAGTWGNTTNTNLGTLIEQAISGYVTQAVSTGTDTTITIPNGATGVARNMYIELTGTGGASTNLIVPANKKLYFIFNNTASGQVTVKVSGQTGVSVPQGKKMVLTSNGTDTVNALNYIADFGSNSATITQLTATSATITNLTLTSLVISNLSIASANITTLTSSSATISTTLALSGGTANGVLYLNGSKVATSGSAVTYDGTTFGTTGAANFATSSGNLGIGTSSPGAKLDVYSATNAEMRLSTAADGYLQLGQFTNGAFIGTSSSDSVDGVLRFGTGGSERGRFSADGTFRVKGAGSSGSTDAVQFSGSAPASSLLLDSSGNLGLGVTPSAWSGVTAFQNKQASFSADVSNNICGYGNNLYYNGSVNKRYQSGAVALYQQSGAQHIWYNAGSSTADSNISFTQAMTLDASGNLVVGGTAATNTAAGRGNITINGSSTAILSVGTGGTERGYVYTQGTDFIINASTGSLALQTSGASILTLSTNGSERARITSGGYSKFSNDGTYVGTGTSYHEFRNTTTNNEIMQMTHTASADPFGMRVKYTAASPNGTSNWFLYCDDSTSLRAEIRSNGGLANYQANDVNLSDERVKTDIKPVGSYWNKIKAIEIVTFKYKDQTHDDGNLGVIAQQVESVAPEFVDVDGFGETPEDGVPLKTVYTTDMYHAAIKALQEAMARIEKLEAEVAALKGA